MYFFYFILFLKPFSGKCFCRGDLVFQNKGKVFFCFSSIVQNCVMCSVFADLKYQNVHLQIIQSSIYKQVSN